MDARLRGWGTDQAKLDRKGFGWVVFSVALTVFMVRMNSYIVNISLPTLSRYFRVSTGEVSWVILSYLLVMTSSMMIFGKLGDRLGLRKIHIWGYVFFIAGSLFCGLSTNVYWLDASRCIQGLGGAMMVTSAFAIIVHFLPPTMTGWAFGICSFANSLGIMIGAPLGGFITGFFSWQWIFLINLPIGAFAIFVARRALPVEHLPHDAKKKEAFDIPGALLSFIGLSALIYVLSMGREDGWGSWIILTTLFIAVFAIMAFLIRENSLRDPILPFDLFRNRDFSLANLTTLVALILLTGGNFLLPFYLELIKGLKPEQVGAVVMIYSLAYAPVALFSGRLSDRLHPSRICSLAMLISVVTCVVFALVLPLPGIAPAVVYLLLLAVSYGLFFASNNHLVMGLAPPEHQGTASGLYSTVVNMGMILGICLFEGAFSYRLPAGMALGDLLPGDASQLIEAFQFAFLLGSAFSLLAFIFSLLTVHTIVKKD